jgi:hypothetical protein
MSGHARKSVQRAEKFNLLTDGSRSFALFFCVRRQRAGVEKVDLSLEEN